MDIQKKKRYNSNSLKGLDPKARYKGKQRIELSLLPDTIIWLKDKGNASGLVDHMVNLAKERNFNPSTIEYKILLQILELKLLELLEKNKGGEAGYKTNSFGSGLSDLKELLNFIDRTKKKI